MARPRITIGIQPQIALYSVILGSVTAFGWYTEKYRRDEEDLDGQLQKMYLRDAQEVRSKLPQMADAIRGQAVDLDGRMDQMVWGGKARLSRPSASPSPKDDGTPNVEDSDDDATTTATTDGSTAADNQQRHSEEEDQQRRRPRKRKKKRNRTKTTTDGGDDDDDNDEAKRNEEEAAAAAAALERQKLMLQSSMAGIAVGAVTVTAVSALLGGGSAGKK